MRRTPLAIAAASLARLALPFAACGGDDDTAEPPTSGGPAGSELVVHGKDTLKFDKDAYTAKAGTVDVRLRQRRLGRPHPPHQGRRRASSCRCRHRRGHRRPRGRHLHALLRRRRARGRRHGGRAHRQVVGRRLAACPRTSSSCSLPATSTTSTARPLAELRAMRAECQEVETGLSLLRRVVQGHLDIVGLELDAARRRRGRRRPRRAPGPPPRAAGRSHAAPGPGPAHRDHGPGVARPRPRGGARRSSSARRVSTCRRSTTPHLRRPGRAV